MPDSITFRFDLRENVGRRQQLFHPSALPKLESLKPLLLATPLQTFKFRVWTASAEPSVPLVMYPDCWGGFPCLMFLGCFSCSGPCKQPHWIWFMVPVILCLVTTVTASRCFRRHWGRRCRDLRWFSCSGLSDM